MKDGTETVVKSNDAREQGHANTNKYIYILRVYSHTRHHVEPDHKLEGWDFFIIYQIEHVFLVWL